MLSMQVKERFTVLVIRRRVVTAPLGATSDSPTCVVEMIRTEDTAERLRKGFSIEHYTRLTGCEMALKHSVSESRLRCFCRRGRRADSHRRSVQGYHMWIYRALM